MNMEENKDYSFICLDAANSISAEDANDKLRYSVKQICLYLSLSDKAFIEFFCQFMQTLKCGLLISKLLNTLISIKEYKSDKIFLESLAICCQRLLGKSIIKDEEQKCSTLSSLSLEGLTTYSLCSVCQFTEEYRQKEKDYLNPVSFVSMLEDENSNLDMLSSLPKFKSKSLNLFCNVDKLLNEILITILMMLVHIDKPKYYTYLFNSVSILNFNSQSIQQALIQLEFNEVLGLIHFYNKNYSLSAHYLSITKESIQKIEDESTDVESQLEVIKEQEE